MNVSVVVASKNEGTRLRSTIESLADTLTGDDEIIVVDDGSTDGSGDLGPLPGASVKVFHTEGLGASGARNFGARRSSGKYLVFSDAHMQYPKGWWEPLLGAIEDGKAGAAAPAIVDLEDAERIGYGLRFASVDLEIEWMGKPDRSPAAAPLLPGACLAMRKEVFGVIGGFDEGLIQWGSEDCEISLNLWLAGFDLSLVPEVQVRHYFRDEHPYDVQWTSVLHNKLRVAMVHFSESRAGLVMEALKGQSGFESARAVLTARGWAQRRDEMAARRKREPEDYFKIFEHRW